MSYVVRVNFPDDDLYCFLKHEAGVFTGKVKEFHCQAQAQEEASKYSKLGAVVLELKEKDDTSRDT